MSSLDVTVVGGGGINNVIKHVGFHRFTGSDKQLIVPINNAPPSTPGQVSQLVFEFRTGGDDLRGGNDNVNILTSFSDGRTQEEDNVNHSSKWDNNSTHSVTIVLNKAVMPNQIASVRLSTTFSGGMGGDNWNMDGVKITAIGNSVNQVLTKYGAKRFAGSCRSVHGDRNLSCHR